MTLDNKSQLPLELFVPPEPTLENFVAGSNAAVLESLKLVRQGKGPQVIYLHGETGVGCTHLLKSLGTVAPQVPTFSPEKRLYLVDNVEKLDPEGQQRIFELVNAVRAHPGTTLVAASHLSPRELGKRGFRSDVTSRLSWGMVFELQPLTSEEKHKEFLKRARQAGLVVTPEALTWIETYLPRDMRTLTRLLEGVNRFSLTTNRAMTVPLLKEWILREGGNVG